MKKPAEKMCVPLFLDLRCNEEEAAVAATAQNGSLLLSNLMEQPLIFLACLLTEKGRWILNSPFLFVFTSRRKLGLELVSLHSSATDAPKGQEIWDDI